MKCAFLFPGQGSQSLMMLSGLASQFPIVHTIFEEASQVLDYDLWALTQTGPEEKLNQTEFTQPALLAADYAVWQCWKSLAGADPVLLAGHSLGEYAALVAAGAMQLVDAIDVVAFRGRAMQAAVPEGSGAMAAIIGLDDANVLTICRAVTSETGVVSPANFNSVGQTVIAGEVLAIEQAIALAKEQGAKIAKRIPVSVPSHCPLMAPAAQQLAEKLQKIDIKAPAIAIIHNVDVRQHDDADAIRKALIDQLTHPVRWVETIKKMAAAGVQKCVECGPGKVLMGLNKRITKEIATVAINTPEKLRLLAESIEE
jgi:[acyl-carrier-protein] S-malonyltransferase